VEKDLNPAVLGPVQKVLAYAIASSHSSGDAHPEHFDEHSVLPRNYETTIKVYVLATCTVALARARPEASAAPPPPAGASRPLELETAAWAATQRGRAERDRREFEVILRDAIMRSLPCAHV